MPMCATDLSSINILSKRLKLAMNMVLPKHLSIKLEVTRSRSLLHSEDRVGTSQYMDGEVLY